jgi:hypothetical protein
MMQLVGIVLCVVLLAILYGIVHDQITARICLEYFTIGHPPVFKTTSPTLLALGWGVIATWWVALPLGVALAVAARAGSSPKRSARALWPSIGVLLAGMAVCALAAGLIAAYLASAGLISLHEPFYSAVPRPKHTGFLADAWAHTASYFSGIVGGWILIVRTWRSRRSVGA